MLDSLKTTNAVIPWVSEIGEPYMDIKEGNLTKTIPIGGWQSEAFIREYARTDPLDYKFLSINNIKEVTSALVNRAHSEGCVYKTSIRVAHRNNKVYYDLCDTHGTVIEIDKDGWRECSDCPVKFARVKGQKPQVMPKRGGTLDTFARHLHFGSPADCILIMSWLVGCLNPTTEFPILILNGGQGTAKSTTTRLLRDLIDPNVISAYQPPKDVRDLVAVAKNSFVVPFDNLSVLPAWFSDDLCRLALGSSGLGGRGLYTDDSLAAFKASRPVILNGITEFIERNDLSERAIQITLPPISQADRVSESTFWERFEEDLPLMLGVLFDMCSKGIKNKGHAHFKELPRMADFSSFVGGLAQEFNLTPDEWMEIFKVNRKEGDISLVENSPVAQSLINMMNDKKNEGVWSGTYHDLHAVLFSYKAPNVSYYPDSQVKLRNELRRLEPVFKQMGIAQYRNGREGKTGRTRIEFRLINDD